MNKPVYNEDELDQINIDERISCCEYNIDRLKNSMDSMHSRISIDEYMMREEIEDVVDENVSPFKVFGAISIVSLLISIIALINNNRRNK